LLDDSTAGFCRDLMRLKLGFGVRENKNWESMKKYKLLFIPSTEIMSQRDQEAIVELVKAGVTVIMCGLMPKYDEEFKDCQILANHFRIKSTLDYRIAAVEYKNGTFPTHMYGTLRTTDQSKIRKIANSENKVLGVCSSRLKGSLYFFSFDIASGGNHKKLSFIESILEGENINPFLYCNDPSVDIAFQSSEKSGLLTIIAPPPGELSDGFEAPKKEIIVRADLKVAGFKSPKLKLTDLFSDEENPTVIKTTAKELSDGLAMEIEIPDGKIYLVQKG